MKKLAVIISALVLVAPAAAGLPGHPYNRWGSKSVRLCDRADFSFRVPNWVRYSNEKVNGHQISAYVIGNTTWFFGLGVSGMWRVNHRGINHVSAARLVPGCVQLTVLWSERL